jgi:hypothetical protein
VDVDEELEDNALLGEATLAKMSAAREDVAETAAVEKTENKVPAPDLAEETSSDTATKEQSVEGNKDKNDGNHD